MAGGDKVDFERITQVYREESGKKALALLEPNFYDMANEYVKRLEQEAVKAVNDRPTSSKTQFLQDELRKAKKRIEQIYQYRERKIALLAQSRASGVEVEVKGLTTQESSLLQRLLGTFVEVRHGIFGTGEEPVKQPRPAPQPVEAKGKGEEVEQAPTSPRPVQPQRKAVMVYITEDVPPFAGIDVTYDLKREDIVSLPQEYGDVLVKKGKARYVDAE